MLGLGQPDVSTVQCERQESLQPSHLQLEDRLKVRPRIES